MNDNYAQINCSRLKEPICIDGDLEKPVWKNAEKSGNFVDLVTGEQAFLNTQMAAFWDDKKLYMGFWIEEPALRA